MVLSNEAGQGVLFRLPNKTRKPMIVEELLTLPPWVDFEGINFELQLINNGGNEIRLVYAITGVDADSPHKQDYDAYGCWANTLLDPIDPGNKGFLVLFENIGSDVDLVYAMRSCWYWLQERGLLGKDKPYG